MALSSCIAAFLTFWAYREVEWTSFGIVGALAVPASLYAFNSVLVPPDPSTVRSWRDYLFDMRVPLFAIGLVFMSSVIISNIFVRGASPLQNVLLFNYGWLAMYAIGLASAKPSVHVVLAIAFPCLLGVASVLLLEGPPDSIFRGLP